MIINKTQNKTISEKELICKSVLSQARGLMFRRKKQNLVMVFSQERKIGLHNCFVFYPINVLVLDSTKRIVEIRKNFRPFQFWNGQKKGKYVVELAHVSSYNVGDVLEIK